MAKKRKRVLSLILSLVMVLSLLPIQALADGNQQTWTVGSEFIADTPDAELPTDIPENTKWSDTYEVRENVLVCEAAEHTHTDACYGCESTEPEHVHTEACLICGEIEHAHTDACYQTQYVWTLEAVEEPDAVEEPNAEETDAAVEAVIAQIAALPTMDALAAMLDSSDANGVAASLTAIAAAQEAYAALTEEQKAQVTNYASLEAMAQAAGWFAMASPMAAYTALQLDQRSAVIVVNGTATFTARLLMDDGSSQSLAGGACRWNSSDPGVATVQDGVVTGVSAGTAKITCTYGGSSVYAYVTVTDQQFTLVYNSNYPSDAKKYTYQNGLTASVGDAVNTRVSYSFAPGETATVESGIFTTINYDLIDYNTSPDGEGTSYNAGDPILMDGNLTLYAQWRDNGVSTEGQTIRVRYYTSRNNYVEKEITAYVTQSGRTRYATFITANNQDTIESGSTTIYGWEINGTVYPFNTQATDVELSWEPGGWFEKGYYYVDARPAYRNDLGSGKATAQFFIRKANADGYGTADLYYSVGTGTIRTERDWEEGTVAGSDDIDQNVNAYVLTSPSAAQIASLMNISLEDAATVRWYVIKKQVDGYHVDGVIYQKGVYWQANFVDPDDGKTVQTLLVEDSARLNPGDVMSGSELNTTLRTFRHWSLSENGQPVDLASLSPFTKDVTIYAVFDYQSGYTVKYVDESTKDEIKTAQQFEATVGSIVNTVNPPAIEGYTFSHQDPASLTVDNSGQQVITLYYTRNSYTVTWVDEDGETVLGRETFEYGTSAAEVKEAEPNDPSKASDAQYSYEFNGWDPAYAQVTGDVTYTATYTETTRSYTYTVEYYYDGTKGEAPAGATTTGIAEYGSQIKASDISYPVSAEYNEINYAVDEVTGLNLTIGADETANVIKVYYATDANGDEIPDKYQAFVKFESKGNGTVSGEGCSQVVTFADKATSGNVTPVLTNVQVTPNDGYAFDIWTKDNGTASVNPEATLKDVAGGTTITFYANFEKDVLVDPSEEDKTPDKPGDGIPDKYQVTVYYEAVNGTVSFGSTVVTKKDASGNPAEDGTAELTAKHIPTTAPIAGYVAASNLWTPTAPEVDLPVVDGQTFTSNYVYIPPYIPPVDPGTDIDDPDVPLADLPGLNTVDHYAYIAGYEDGTVRPNNNITRAEVATIFFRLFTDEYRETYWSTNNPFSDVAYTAWYNNAVSTTSNAGIIAGYPDGTFQPNNYITRAEFATIAARFLSEEYVGPDLFTDISGHWAAEYINRAANAGWINGYPDGSFRPNAYITRAEAMTLVNSMLGRMPHKDHMLENMVKWPDNPEAAWYYEAVQEATNGHDYDWYEEEDQLFYEIWTALQPNRDWAALEKEWSNAYSAPGGEVIG